MDSVESFILVNVVVLIIISEGNCLIFMCKNIDCGINMYVVIEVQYIVIMVEYYLLDVKDVEKCFENIKLLCYLCWLVVVMVVLLCGCFSKLNGGGWDVFFIIFLVSGLVMFVW